MKAESRDVRTQILDAFVDAVIECGIEGATYRDVARRGGTSTGAVQYHFPEKALLIQEALNYAHERYRGEAESEGSSPTDLPPYGALRRRVLRGLPITPYTLNTFPFYLQYWAYAARDAAVRDIHVRRWEWLSRDIEEEITRAFNNTTGIDPEDAEDLACALVALKFGLGANSTLRPERYTPERVRRLAEKVVDAFVTHQQGPHHERPD